MKNIFLKRTSFILTFALLIITCIGYTPTKASTSDNSMQTQSTNDSSIKVKLKSSKGDYLHRPDTPHGVTTWNTGSGNEWTLEILNGKIKLKSSKGDYLHRSDAPHGVTTWNTGSGNEWTLELAN